MKKALRYLGYLSSLIGLSLLGVVFIYYMFVLSASVGVLFMNPTTYNYIKESVGLNILQIYNNLFFIMFSLGSFGAVLTYTGSIVVPRVIKE